MPSKTKSPSKSPKKNRKAVVAPPPTTFNPESVPLSPHSPGGEVQSISRLQGSKAEKSPRKSPKKSPQKSPKKSPKKTPKKSPKKTTSTASSKNSANTLPTINLDHDEVSPSSPKVEIRKVSSPKPNKDQNLSPRRTPVKTPTKSPKTKRRVPSELPSPDFNSSHHKSPKGQRVSRLISEFEQSAPLTSSPIKKNHTLQDDSSSGRSLPEANQTQEIPALTEEEKRIILRNAREYLNANIRLLSACQDEEQTTDCSNVLIRFGLRNSLRGSQAFGYDGGACTSVLLKTLYEYHESPEIESAPKWIDLLHILRGELKDKGYKQVPALTSSRPVSMKDEFNIIPKNHNGSRKALVIGIRYKGRPWELPGCHNDCYAMITYLKRVHHFTDDDITILMDDGKHTIPTRENILRAFHRFAFSVKAGDAAFFHFAGHGSSTKDMSGDEKSGLDQTLLPVDVMENGGIVDDDIFRILLVPLPRGLQLTAIVDCCHSGTIFDLPFEFIGDEKYEDGKEMEFRKVTFPHMKIVRAERNRIRMMTELKERASVIEREIVKPIDIRPRNPFTMAVIEERPHSQRKMKVAVDEEATRLPELEEKGKAKDNAALMAIGCLLLCCNPLKFFGKS